MDRGEAIAPASAFLLMQSKVLPTRIHQQLEQRLLHMAPVLRLVPDPLARAVEHLGGDLLAGVGGKAVEGYRAGCGAVDQRVVDAVRRKRAAAVVVPALVPHGHPDVGVDGVGAVHRPDGIADQPRAESRLQLIAVRCGHHHLDTGRRSEPGQRTSDVVPIAHIGETQSAQRAERLAQGHQIGQDLAGVVVRGEQVDHRYLAARSELLDPLVRPGAQPHRVDLARQHHREVAQRLAPRELQLVAAQHDWMSSQLDDRDLERQAGTRRRTLEDERHMTVRERPRGKRRLLELVRPVQQSVQLAGAQLGAGEEVARQAGSVRRAGAPPLLVRAWGTVSSTLRVVTWNLFHGRSLPPAGRSLRDDFAAVLAGWEWDVALLQEVPPWWSPILAMRAGAQERTVLTSRNWLTPLQRALAERLPDLMKSWGGGANAILSRRGI